MVRAISDNSDSAAGGEVFFTPDRATDTLPLVKRVVADMLQLNRSIASQREQLKGIDGLSETIEQSSYQEELSDIRASLKSDEQRLKSCVEELRSLGAEVHHPIDGTVDFPALMNRRRVFLCWRPGDEIVSHWREVGQSARERKRIEAGAVRFESLR